MTSRRRARDFAVRRFIDSDLAGRLELVVSADDLVDGDLYWESSPLAFVAKKTTLLLDDTVATLDPTVLVVCLRELKSLGFTLDVAWDRPDGCTSGASLAASDGVRVG